MVLVNMLDEASQATTVQGSRAAVGAKAVAAASVQRPGDVRHVEVANSMSGLPAAAGVVRETRRRRHPRSLIVGRAVTGGE